VRTIASALGLLLLVAAIVVGALAATGVLSDAAQSYRVGGSEVNIVPATGQFEPKIDFVGETTTAGELTWTVDTASQRTEIQGFVLLPSPLRGNFVVVSFTVKNDSDGPVTLTPESLVLVDEARRESPPAASVNTEYVVPEYAIQAC
jgi:polyisoprenoid-binding protein YceI